MYFQWAETFTVCLLNVYLDSVRVLAYSLNFPLGPKNNVSFWSPHASPQTYASAFLVFFLLWNDVQLQHQLEFCCAVFWTFAQYVRPLLGTILCVREIWSGSNNHVDMYHAFHWLAKQNINTPSPLPPPKKKMKSRHCTNFEANLWPENGDFFGGPEMHYMRSPRVDDVDLGRTTDVMKWSTTTK